MPRSLVAASVALLLVTGTLVAQHETARAPLILRSSLVLDSSGDNGTPFAVGTSRRSASECGAVVARPVWDWKIGGSIPPPRTWNRSAGQHSSTRTKVSGSPCTAPTSSPQQARPACLPPVCVTMNGRATQSCSTCSRRKTPTASGQADQAAALARYFAALNLYFTRTRDSHQGRRFVPYPHHTPTVPAARSANHRATSTSSCPYAGLIRSIWQRDADWAISIAWRESRCIPTAYNPSGAEGLFQLLGHGDLMPCDWSDPVCNITAAWHLYQGSGRAPWRL